MSNTHLESERPFHSLTQKEFDELKKSGILWELYPEAPERKNMKQSVVNIKGEWVPTESKEIEFLGIEEGPQGEDVLEFNYKGETYKRTVYR